MKLKEIIEFIDENIPKNLALKNDEIGFRKEYDLNQNINSIEIFMDLYPEFDTQKADTLILTHHPPLFNPKTPTYTIHSNWDIINGGANEALAESLKLDVISPFDKTTNIIIPSIINSHFLQQQEKLYTYLCAFLCTKQRISFFFNKSVIFHSFKRIRLS